MTRRPSPARPGKRKVGKHIDALRALYSDDYKLTKQRSPSSEAYARECMQRCERVLDEGPTLADLIDAAAVHVAARDECKKQIPAPLGSKNRGASR